MGKRTKSLFQLAVIIQLLLSAYCSDYSIKDFLGGAFSLKPADGLYKIDVGMNDLNEGGNIVIAYGDFNSDKNVDLVTLSDDRKSVKILVWDQDAGKFKFLQQISTQSIVSAIPIDFDFDGKLDLLLTTEDSNKYYFRVFLQQADLKLGGLQDTADFMFSGEKTQPMVLDIDGDRKSEILFIGKDSDGKLARLLAFYDDKSDEHYILKNFEDFVSDEKECQKYSALSSINFASPHYNAFTDLNNDCKADIFILSKTEKVQVMEFWLKQEDGKFCLAKYHPLDIELKAVAFTDIDFDGGIDMVAVSETTTEPKTLQMHLYFNKVLPSQDALCGTSSERYKKYPYEDFNVTSNSKDVITYGMTSNFDSSLKLYSEGKNFPPMLRFADTDADTYPDLLVTLSDAQGGSPRAYVMMNRPCGEVFCEEKDHRRYLYLGKGQSPYSLVSEDHAIHASYFDIGETGTMDFIISTVDANKSSKLIFIYNYLNPDTFFLKALGLNGMDESSVGGIYYGTSFQCIVTTLDGEWKISHVSQLSQSSNHALQTPFAYIGLGRTNNYVENLNVGLPKNNVHFRAWTPIIPNSQLIVFPYTDDPNNWSVAIYVNPTKATVIVVISTVSILVVLGIVIIYLHRKEKEEDRKHQESFAHVVRY